MQRVRLLQRWTVWLKFSRIFCRAEAGQELLEASVWARAYHIWLSHEQCCSATQSALNNTIPKMEAELPISLVWVCVDAVAQIWHAFLFLTVSWRLQEKECTCEPGRTVDDCSHKMPLCICVCDYTVSYVYVKTKGWNLCLEVPFFFSCVRFRRQHQIILWVQSQPVYESHMIHKYSKCIHSEHSGSILSWH